MKAIAADFPDATRWDAALTRAGFGSYEPRAFGNQLGASAQRNPGRGIFAKSHFACFDYEHVAIRVVPQFQEKWIGSKPLIFGTETDEFGNHMATIGAGQINGTGCTGGVLVSEVNRPSDLHDPHKELEALKYDMTHEDAIIERLFAKDARYGDNLEYDCSPANDGTLRYNSNSFAAGLMNSTGIQLPTFPSRRPSKYPGWWKPVPVVHFGPQ